MVTSLTYCAEGAKYGINIKKKLITESYFMLEEFQKKNKNQKKKKKKTKKKKKKKKIENFAVHDFFYKLHQAEFHSK